MKRVAPRAVGELIASAVPQLLQRLAEARIKAAWAELVGADVARRARPQALHGGTLVVTVDNSPWLHELTLRTPELCEKIGRRFPVVTTLRLAVGKLSTDPADVPATLPASRTLTDDDRRDIDRAVAAIADPTLATAARRLMTRARRSSVLPR